MSLAKANPHNYSHAEKKRFRKSFGRQADKMAIPNLLDIQLKSYADFLKTDSKSGVNQNTGLHAAFASVFPIQSCRNKFIGAKSFVAKFTDLTIHVGLRKHKRKLSNFNFNFILQ